MLHVPIQHTVAGTFMGTASADTAIYLQVFGPHKSAVKDVRAGTDISITLDAQGWTINSLAGGGSDEGLAAALLAM